MVDLVSPTSTSSAAHPEPAQEEARAMDFVGNCLYLLDHKWIIVAICLLFGATGGAYAFLATPWYRAEVVLTPVKRSSPLSGLGQLGGLASLAGIDIGSQGTEESLAVLRSRSFTAEFINSKSLIPALFAEEWDAPHKDWKDADSAKRPDIRKAVEYFNEKVRSIGEDNRAGTVTIAVLWKDPRVAADWANELAKLINARLRKSALDEAERNVRYLQQEIAAANIASMQQSIGRILEAEMQKLMMARGSDEYAFKIVDNAVPARKRYRPQRILIVAMSAVAGALLSAGFMLLKRTLLAELRRRRNQR